MLRKGGCAFGKGVVAQPAARFFFRQPEGAGRGAAVHRHHFARHSALCAYFFYKLLILFRCAGSEPVVHMHTREREPQFFLQPVQHIKKAQRIRSAGKPEDHMVALPDQRLLPDQFFDTVN